eukprot:gnl/Trimastix_PCT/1183.p1 GENE.gnl/Trimastix_PCT/1183~~gnl/Trimastix_PCT/1183.p1  ORF type:complete len:957 (-),score=320.33 gnl/Trimastix_PCT/1183:444-3314(-)
MDTRVQDERTKGCHAKPCRCSPFEAVFFFISKAKIFILIFWVIVFGFGLWLGPNFLSETSIEFAAPAGTPAYDAHKLLAAHFPEHAAQTPIAILFKSLKNESILTPFVKNASLYLNHTLPQNEFITAVLGYYTVVGTPLELSQAQFLGRPATRPTATMLLVLLSPRRPGSKMFAMLDHIDKAVAAVNTKPHKVHISSAGAAPVLRALKRGVAFDLLVMDGMVLPIALLVLALVLRNLQMVLIPLAAFFVTMMGAFLVMYPIAKYAIHIVSFAPALMLACMLAMSVDYSLFLLSRFREELKAGRTLHDATRHMYIHAGRIVLFSGTTLAITFLGLCLLPLQIIQSMGLAASISLAFTMLVSLTLTPALLLTFGRFFASDRVNRCCRTCWRYCCCCCRRRRRKPEERYIIKARGDEERGLVDSVVEERIEKERERQRRSLWYKIGLASTHKVGAILIFLAIAAMITPVALQLLHLRTSAGREYLIPMDSPIKATISDLQRYFTAGKLSPYYLVFEATHATAEHNQTVFCAEFYKLSHHFFGNLTRTAEYPVAQEDVQSIAYMMGGPFEFALAESLTDPQSLLYDLGGPYRFLLQHFTAGDMRYAVAIFQVGFDPLGDKLNGFVDHLRALIPRYFNDTTGYRCLVDGLPVQEKDAIAAIYRYFPMMVSVTSGVVFLLVSLVYRSLFISLRALVTLGMTICWTYGWSIIFFTTGLFEIHALCWFVPIMSFSIMVGLGLDYDIFLLSRVYEFRRMGYTNRASIVKGVYRTGHIITAAGVIMAIAFSGLMIGGIAVMSHMGFMLCFSVLIDAFVVRTLLVPSLLALAGRLNWWPGRMPRGAKDEMVMHEQSAVEEDREEGEAAPGPTGAPPPYSPVAADETEMKEFLAHRTRRSTLCGSFCEPGALGPCDDHKDPEPSAPPPLAPDEVTPLVHGGAPAEEDEDRPRPALEAGPAGPMRTGIQ